MDIPDSLLCLFTGHVEQKNGAYVIEIPEQERDVGTVQEGHVYRVALLPAVESEQNEESSRASVSAAAGQVRTKQEQQSEQPPVEEGETRDVEIEDIGEQGDGIARIGPGYVVFIPDTRIGDEVRIEITDARENFAFAEIVETK